MVALSSLLSPISDAISYTALFGSLYFEVFLLVTFIGKYKSVDQEEFTLKTSVITNPSKYTDSCPTATVIVPCFNEEKTVQKTVHSLLKLNYPKEKLKILLINDGSKDNTGKIIDQYKDHPQIEVYHKKNGGKYTALNYGLERTTSDIVGCLDADSFADRNALKNISSYFSDKSVMAVAPSVVITESSNIIRKIQKAEYNLGIFIRKVFGMLDAIHITPGPFSFFRKSVFDTIGIYKHAHNTEDLEIAFRMQKHHMKIVNAHKAFVFTVGPKTIKKLYIQRVRWTSGFFSNLVDYRSLIFNKKYGHLGMIILPMTIFGVLSTLALIGVSVANAAVSVQKEVVKYQAVGVHFKLPDFSTFSFDWFFIHTNVLSLIGFCLLLTVFGIITYGQKVSTGKWRVTMDSIYFIALYSFIAPFWLIKSVFNTTLSKTAPWR